MHFSSELLEIEGRGRVEAARVRLGDGRVERIACDGILLSGRFVPESSLVRLSHLELDPASGGPRIDQFGRCSDPAYFAAGNLLRPIETAGWSFREGRRIAGLLPPTCGPNCRSPRPVSPSIAAVRSLCVPQRLLDDPTPGLAHLQLRVSEAASGRLRILADGRPVWERALSCLPERRLLVPLAALRLPPDTRRLEVAFLTSGRLRIPADGRPVGTRPVLPAGAPPAGAAGRPAPTAGHPAPGSRLPHLRPLNPRREPTMRIAALDQGTTSTRVLVASQDGSADIQLALRHQQHHPQSGWVEHDPLELLANLQRCLEASGRVDAIGLANQGESLHGLGRPQRRAVVAADRLAGQPHHPAHRARQRRRGAGPGTQRPAARCLFLGQQAGLDRRAPSCRSPGSRGRPPAPGNQRRLVSTACAEPSPPTSPPPRAPH